MIDEIFERLDDKYSQWAKSDTTYMQSDVEEAKSELFKLINEQVIPVAPREANELYSQDYIDGYSQAIEDASQALETLFGDKK